MTDTDVLTERIKEVPIGFEFQLKDLFRPWEWEKKSTGEKTTLGRNFSMDVDRNVYGNVKYVRTTPQNQRIYTKTKAIRLFQNISDFK